MKKHEFPFALLNKRRLSSARSENIIEKENKADEINSNLGV